MTLIIIDCLSHLLMVHGAPKPDMHSPVQAEELTSLGCNGMIAQPGMS